MTEVKHGCFDFLFLDVIEDIAYQYVFFLQHHFGTSFLEYITEYLLFDALPFFVLSARVAFFELSSVVAGPQVLFRAWPLTFGTVPSFVALPPAGRSVPTLFFGLLPWHIAPFLSSPKGSGI